LNALVQLAQPSTRGDPEAAVVWVSKSQRHLAASLAADGSPAARSWWAGCYADILIGGSRSFGSGHTYGLRDTRA
jgi:hypothetical protein